MQTILGAGGAIGKELAKSLKDYTNQIRLVARNPKKINDSDELFKADLTNKEDIIKAIKGSTIVYVTVGFEYNAKVWRKNWPTFMQNVIDACKAEKAKLVFFDNIYMYHRDQLNGMTEKTQVTPTSKKGEIRFEVAQMILNAIEKGEIEALIARSADFYGPGIGNSVILETIYKNLKAGKKAQLLGKPDKLHNYTFTPDAGKGTALLGNTPKAYGRVWHLPTHPKALTHKQWVELFAKEMNVKPSFMAAPGWMLSIMGLFNPIMSEISEMNYQNTCDYVFLSNDFNNTFNFTPTSPEEAVKQIVAFDKK